MGGNEQGSFGRKNVTPAFRLPTHPAMDQLRNEIAHELPPCNRGGMRVMRNLARLDAAVQGDLSVPGRGSAVLPSAFALCCRRWTSSSASRDPRFRAGFTRCATGSADIQLTAGNPHLLQQREDLLRHARGQLDRAVCVVDFDAADVRARDARLRLRSRQRDCPAARRGCGRLRRGRAPSRRPAQIRPTGARGVFCRLCRDVSCRRRSRVRATVACRG